MYLKKLEINGFKSFAKKTTLEFTRGITAVVGPNGSGKSNVADSLRWVMGEQSIKTLRGKKSEDVIFSGSDKKARLGLAEVSMELDNRDQKVPIDYTDLAITRRLYRSGDSDYLINGAKSKLSDINLLLTQANFGHRTYAIIGQGMIDNFLLATPEERKEFFDEATGVKQYQIKKNQTIAKLNQVWQNLTTANVRLKEMEPQLNLLTRQVKKLNKRKEIEAELTALRLAYYHASWQTVNENYENELSKVETAEKEKNIMEQSVQTLGNELNSVTQNSGLNREIENLRAKHQALLDEKIKLKEQLLVLKNLSPSKTSTSGIKTMTPDKINEFNAALIALIAFIEKNLSLDKQADYLITLAEINSRLSQLLSSLSPYLTPSKAKLEPAATPANPEIARLENAIVSLEKQASELQENIKRMLSEDEAKRSNLWQVQQKYQLSQQKYNQLNNQLNELRVALARVETKKFDLRQEILQELGSLDTLNQSPLPALKEDPLTAQNKINRLKAQLEMIGGLDPEIESEYQKTQERFDFLTGQIDDLNKTIESLKKIIDELNQIIKKQMTASFSEINDYFQKYFKTLFNGGSAELVMTKEEIKPEGDEEPLVNNPAINFFQEKNNTTYSGIEIHATPPGKKLKSINILSGGERALTSIALICAIISSNPAPFVVLDEVDAALDESNSIRFAQILSDLSHKTQFIVITHNRATMEKASLLYGVTMGDDGASKLISIRLEDSNNYISR